MIKRLNNGTKTNTQMENKTELTPEQQEHKTAKDVFNDLNNSRAIKWEGLSDGGKWTRAVEAMEIYANQFKKNKLPKDFLEPVPLKAGYPGVLIYGTPVKEDFRIISESNYQLLVSLISSKDTITEECHKQCGATQSSGDTNTICLNCGNSIKQISQQLPLVYKDDNRLIIKCKDLWYQRYEGKFFVLEKSETYGFFQHIVKAYTKGEILDAFNIIIK